jgi:hypothetical protein
VFHLCGRVVDLTNPPASVARTGTTDPIQLTVCSSHPGIGWAPSWQISVGEAAKLSKKVQVVDAWVERRLGRGGAKKRVPHV